MTSIQRKTKELLRFHSSCHSNWATVVARYVANAYHAKELSIPNMNSLQLKTKELLGFHSGCHDNWVTIITRYVADAYCFKKAPYQIWPQYDLKQGGIKVSFWLPWQPNYHSNGVGGWCLLSQGTSTPNMDSIRLKTKELLTYHCGCHKTKKLSRF